MSCDTFVALPPATDGCIIFGKNSDRPANEVQEIVYVPGKHHAKGDKVKCTYIEIAQVEHTHDVILSKPAWMWGTEMGANQHGVCIGNEAIWTKMSTPEDKQEKLLGMDLVRLGLERSSSAREAVDVITSLLASPGQGGRCYEDPERADVVYHNSFIIADNTEAWVLETAGAEWVAQRVSEGCRNLSNLVTIGTDYDLKSSGLENAATTRGLWKGGSTLSFSEVFGSEPPPGISCPGAESPHSRLAAGKELMEKIPSHEFNTLTMMSILRDEESGLCRLGHVGSATVSSQVSVLCPPSSGKPACHWLTGTPNPARSVFKPFVFTPGVSASGLTVSPMYRDDPVKVVPRFLRTVDRRHDLYRAHAAISPLAKTTQHEDLLTKLRDLESNCIQETEEFIANYDSSSQSELDTLFKDIVESEMKFYPINT